MPKFRNITPFILSLMLILTLAFAACGGDDEEPTEGPTKISILLFEKAVDLPSQDVDVLVHHLTLSAGSDQTLQGPGAVYVISGTAEVSDGGATQTISADEAEWYLGPEINVKNTGDASLQAVAVQVLPSGSATTQAATKIFEQSAKLPDPRVNMVIRHVTLPVGFKTPAHTHKGPGPRYILSGITEIVEDGATLAVPAGDAYWESGAVMTGENISDVPMELIAFQLLPIE